MASKKQKRKMEKASNKANSNPSKGVRGRDSTLPPRDRRKV